MGPTIGDFMKGDDVSKLSIDRVFLSEMQGKPISTGYVPDTPDPKQGASVACGINLGQTSLQQLKSMNLNPILTGKLYPYLGRTGDEARTYLRNFPLRLSENEVNIIVNEMLTLTIDNLVTKYNKVAQNSFQSLPSEWQTVIASVYLQYEDLPVRFPVFWRYLTEADWSNALAMLRNFDDNYVTRRNTEADYIELCSKKNDS